MMRNSASPADVAAFATAMEAINRRNGQRLFGDLFPDEDMTLPDGSVIHARRKYAKHLEFFEEGADYRER